MNPSDSTDNLYWDDSYSDLRPSSSVVPFAALICFGAVLYFGLRCAEWWLEPPPVHFPPPIIAVQISAYDAFARGNYYMVPSNLHCVHTRSPKALVITCKPR